MTAAWTATGSLAAGEGVTPNDLTVEHKVSVPDLGSGVGRAAASRFSPVRYPISLRTVFGYNFGRMALASCSSSDRDGGAPAGATAIRR